MVGGDDAAWWVALRAAPGIGDVLGRRLCERFGGPGAVLTAAPADLAEAGCPPAVAERLGRSAIRAAGEREVERIRAAGARVIGLDDPEYPPLLRELHDAPLHLIARGLPLSSAPAVAIVGARRATPYGLAVARELAEGLTHAGVVVVSGLARGIDGAAHEGALAARGCTLAVLGSGVDVVYPPSTPSSPSVCCEWDDAQRAADGHGPAPAHFPARNRILAGMTRAPS
jgi:DNA processing protein